MSDDYMKWTPEMQERLVSLWRRSYTVLDIADAMGIQYEQAKYGIKRAKSGAWGEDIRARMLFLDAPEAEDDAAAEEENAEAFETPSADEIDPYTELDIVESADPAQEDDAPADILAVKAAPAIMTLDDLLFELVEFAREQCRAERIVELHAWRRDCTAQVTFERSESLYVLSMQLEKEEAADGTGTSISGTRN